MNPIGLLDRTQVSSGYIVPLGADLDPFVEPRMTDGCMILAKLGVKGWSLRLPAALKSEIRAHSDFALDRSVGADNESAFASTENFCGVEAHHGRHCFGHQ